MADRFLRFAKLKTRVHLIRFLRNALQLRFYSFCLFLESRCQETNKDLNGFELRGSWFLFAYLKYIKWKKHWSLKKSSDFVSKTTITCYKKATMSFKKVITFHQFEELLYEMLSISVLFNQIKLISHKTFNWRFLLIEVRCICSWYLVCIFQV